MYLQYGKQRQVRLRIGTDNPVKFKNIAWEYFDKEMKLTSFGFENFEQFQARAASIDPDFRCYDDALEFIIESRKKQQRCQWIDDRNPTGEDLDGILTTQLFLYQQKRILFAAKARRSLIADEMELGKTIALNFFGQLFATFNKK